jgi:hypothetical protein
MSDFFKGYPEGPTKQPESQKPQEEVKPDQKLSTTIVAVLSTKQESATETASEETKATNPWSTPESYE